MRTSVAFVSLAMLGFAIAGCSNANVDRNAVASAVTRACTPIADTAVKLPGGTFVMGEDDVYAEEGPVRQTTASGSTRTK